MKYYLTEFNHNEKSIAVDDMLLTKEGHTTAGSKMLENFTSLFDAEVVSRLKNNGYFISGKANVGEFGLDVIEETSFFHDTDTGKGAIAELIKNNKVSYGLSVDNNGAPRRAAAVSDISYLKPSYGVVSRYGLIPTVCSSEGIGISAKKAAGILEILNIISGKDDKDGTMFPEKEYDYSINDIRGKKIAILSDYFKDTDDEIAEKMKSVKSALTKAGAFAEEIDFNLAEEIQAAWHIALCAETCNNLSRYDGVKFGYRTEKYNNIEELYTKTRTEAFGFLTKAIILYGSDVLSKDKYDLCYDKALRMRRVAREKLSKLFKNYDILALPACSKLSFSTEDLQDSINTVYREELFSSLSSLIGTPCAVTNQIQFITDTRKENNLLSVISTLEAEQK